VPRKFENYVFLICFFSFFSPIARFFYAGFVAGTVFIFSMCLCYIICSRMLNTFRPVKTSTLLSFICAYALILLCFYMLWFEEIVFCSLSHFILFLTSTCLCCVLLRTSIKIFIIARKIKVPIFLSLVTSTYVLMLFCFHLPWFREAIANSAGCCIISSTAFRSGLGDLFWLTLFNLLGILILNFLLAFLLFALTRLSRFKTGLKELIYTTLPTFAIFYVVRFCDITDIVTGTGVAGDLLHFLAVLYWTPMLVVTLLNTSEISVRKASLFVLCTFVLGLALSYRIYVGSVTDTEIEFGSLIIFFFTPLEFHYLFRRLFIVLCSGIAVSGMMIFCKKKEVSGESSA